MKRILFAAILSLFALAAFGCGSDSGHTVDGISDNVVPVSMREDATDSWKVSTIACSADPKEYALSYYKECFEDGDRVHWVVNFSTNTTTCINDMDGLLSVTTYEYVDGEEHSAKEIGGGMKLDEFLVYVDSGKIEEIQ